MRMAALIYMAMYVPLYCCGEERAGMSAEAEGQHGGSR